MKGSVIWNLQRYSSLIVLSYVVYVMMFIFSFEGEIGFFDWTKFFLSFQMRFLTSIVCVFILIHAFIGLWTVGTDYLTSRTLGFLSYRLTNYADLIRNSYQILFVFLGLIFLIIVLIVIWI